MRDGPDRSLGVVTLNQKQRDLIREEFEYAVASDDRAAEYVESWKERNDGLEEFLRLSSRVVPLRTGTCERIRGEPLRRHCG
jgi:hypothetical protein